VSKVREAMVPEPRTLDAATPATEAGELLAREEVRAVFVSRDGRFLGVLTRKTLVREVVAPGLDPKTFTLRSAPALLKKSKPWKDYATSAKPLRGAIERLLKTKA